MTGPNCIHCSTESVRVTGHTIYPHMRKLHDRIFYLCPNCQAYVGTHQSSEKPLGFPANKELRRARGLLHAKLDPIWKGRKKWKRTDVYAYIARSMDIPMEDAHVAMFRLEDCRNAWRALERLEREISKGTPKHEAFEKLDELLEQHAQVIE